MTIHVYRADWVGGKFLSIPKLMRQNEIVIEDDAIGAACPAYNAEMPRMVRDFYTVNDNCIHCGICAKVCPANNITVTENSVEFSDHCEVCYGCLHNCPQHVIHPSKETGTMQFRNEHVTVAGHYQVKQITENKGAQEDE